jgi:hypothetical protein
MESRRVNVKAILADADLRRKLMVSTIQATQAREGIDTTAEQADRAYYVVSEGEKATFLQLEPHRQKQGRAERRHEAFVKFLQGAENGLRFDVPRRDFIAIEGVPLAYSQIGYVAHLFREFPPLSSVGDVWQGVISRDDDRYYRFWWEVEPNSAKRPWVPLHKGGDFARFYYDADLVIDWSERAQSEFHRLRDVSIYFQRGLTWPRRTAKGLNVRRLPPGCVFSDKGPALLLSENDMESFALGLLNSLAFEYIFRCRTSFSWEIGVMKAMPLPGVGTFRAATIGRQADSIFDSKSTWDEGNEVSTRFHSPWLVRNDGIHPDQSIPFRLAELAAREVREEARIRLTYSELNDEVFHLYGLPEATRRVFEAMLGERSPEVLWPQMEGKPVDQKRMEHVWRLLSYAVKRVLETDDDGIVPFNAVNGEPRLVERVRQELATLFPDRDANQVEVEIVNELSKVVKGYRKCASLDEWLDNVFFEYHTGLYKNRPVFWHIASARGTSRFAFGALVHYHRFDKNRMAKLRASYLRDAIEEFRREAGLADKAGRSDDRLDWQAKVEEAQALDRNLQLIQEGHHEGIDGSERDYRILTPWKRPEERPKGWDPDVDDGVKVNIQPLEKACVLRVGKVT